MKEELTPYVGKSLYIKKNDWYCFGALLLSVSDESFSVQFGNDVLKLNYNEVVEVSPIDQCVVKHCVKCGKVLVFNGELCFNCISKKEKVSRDSAERIKELHILPKVIE